MIVKVQMPLTSNVSSPPCLVYNEDRTLEVQLPIDKSLRAAMGDDTKQFFHAHMEGTILHLDKIAPWQEW